MFRWVVRVQMNKGAKVSQQNPGLCWDHQCCPVPVMVSDQFQLLVSFYGQISSTHQQKHSSESLPWKDRVCIISSFSFIWFHSVALRSAEIRPKLQFTQSNWSQLSLKWTSFTFLCTLTTLREVYTSDLQPEYSSPPHHRSRGTRGTWSWALVRSAHPAIYNIMK